MGSGQSQQMRNPRSQNPQNFGQHSNPPQAGHHHHGRPSAPASGGGKVVVMNNDVALVLSSVKLVKTAGKSGMYSVVFTLDTLVETIVSAFFFVNDMRDPLLEITYELAADEKYKIPPKHLKFPPGRPINIAENSYCLELGKYSEEELANHTNVFYPMILRIEKMDPLKADKKVFLYYFHFVKEEGEYVIKMLKQKMELNGQAFEVNEIYGINSTEFGKQQSATIGDSEKECIICFSDTRDTIILPCRHMCLCLGCAKSLQSQASSKCPICRKDIESFLRLTKNAHQQAALNH